jgi:alpha-amylase/alpha-mannosidase (GH57 family)
MPDRYICIHSHFYQPPRENAWLEVIEIQDSAYPYHDWNARITEECYAANAFSRILDDQGRIRQIVNNYANMSFNVGPTLLAWMEKEAPGIYRAILAADEESRERFSGHGSAISQAYNHTILPLSNPRDKYTQVFWGIRDFEYRFGRSPEGMWLPECAVDLATLDVLASLGIRFTILAPHQASRIRAPGESTFQPLPPSGLDTTMPYLQRLPSGLSIAIFFYHGDLSHAVAFEGILGNGDAFAKRIISSFNETSGKAQLIHLATDGETYGHHQKYADMALSYALDAIMRDHSAQITNYGEFLERHPPTHEVEILENTSWSCAHGIERWRGDCGCRSGLFPGWRQAWRGPLREALDKIRDEMAAHYEQKSGEFFKDPWQARNDYIKVVLNRSGNSLKLFIDEQNKQGRSIRSEDILLLVRLLEMQRHSLLMYTSCGWFFDELSGIETVQVIQYAGRAIQLLARTAETDIEERFLGYLEEAKSNISSHGDGRRIYEKFVRPSMVDLRNVAAHSAITWLFEPYSEPTQVYCYTAYRTAHESAEAGKARFIAGETKVSSEITGAAETFCYGVVHLGDHNLSCGISSRMGKATYKRMVKELSESFEKADFPEAFRLIDKYFPKPLFSLASLFRDEQRKLLDILLETAFIDSIAVYRHVYDIHVPLVRFLKESGTPVPAIFQAAGELVINHDLRRLLKSETLDSQAIENLLEGAALAGLKLDADTLEYALRAHINATAEAFSKTPYDTDLLRQWVIAVELVSKVPFEVNLRTAQNLYYDLTQRFYHEYKLRFEEGDPSAGDFLAGFRFLGEKLRVVVE